MSDRALGQSGLVIPPVVFGAYPLGGTNWGPRDDDEAVRALTAAFDAGMTAVDTAPVYGFGLSEELVGRALRGRRDGIVVMSKVGLRWDRADGRVAFVAAGPDGAQREVRHDGRPASVRAEVEQSLARLGVERLDLVQLHAPDPDVPPAESLGALVELRAAGKVRAIGSSNLSLGQLRSAHAALQPEGLASEQLHYSLLARGAEAERLPWAIAEGVGVLAYSPLDQGLLAGAVPAERRFPAGDKRAARVTFEARNRARVNAALGLAVRPIAEARGATVAQVVIAWTAAQPGISGVLVGARRVAHAVENAAAGRLELCAEELAAIARSFADLALASSARGKPGRGRLVRLFARTLGRLRRSAT